jgi:hypothetical protein
MFHISKQQLDHTNNPFLSFEPRTLQLVPTYNTDSKFLLRGQQTNTFVLSQVFLLSLVTRDDVPQRAAAGHINITRDSTCSVSWGVAY